MNATINLIDHQLQQRHIKNLGCVINTSWLSNSF